MKEKISVVLPVLVGDDPFLIALTEFCIRAMWLRTALPYELVVVETGTRHFERFAHYDRGLCADLCVDKYVHCPERTTVVKDHNTAIREVRAAIVHLLVSPGRLLLPLPGPGQRALRRSVRRTCGRICWLDGATGPLLTPRVTRGAKENPGMS